jgi:hypothetical protein
MYLLYTPEFNIYQLLPRSASGQAPAPARRAAISMACGPLAYRRTRLTEFDRNDAEPPARDCLPLCDAEKALAKGGFAKAHDVEADAAKRLPLFQDPAR